MGMGGLVKAERIPRIGCVLCVMTLINIIHNYNYTLHAHWHRCSGNRSVLRLTVRGIIKEAEPERNYYSCKYNLTDI